MTFPRGGDLRAAAFSAAFLLTGVGTALLGAALPAMLREWHLSDRGGGQLLFSAFAGSSLGVLLAGRASPLRAALGLVGTAVAALLLSLGSRLPLLPCFLLYGAGLGTTMTAISILRAREIAPNETPLVLNRLNLLWAMGACCAPVLGLHSLHLVSVEMLFRWIFLAFAAAAALVALLTRGEKAPRSARRPTFARQRLAPLRMCIFAAAAVGLETAIGGWLTTYTQRMAHATGLAVTANSAFWVGLLISRGIHSLRSGRALETGPGIAGHLAVLTLATALLVAVPLGTVLPLAALLAGLGLGPLYPLVLSWALPRYRSTAVFLLAGAGAALLPWLTGVVSSHFRSLRTGLVAPCAAVLILLAAGFFMRREIGAPEEIPA